MKIVCLRAYPADIIARQRWMIDISLLNESSEPHQRECRVDRSGRISLLYPIAPASFALPESGKPYCLNVFGALNPLQAYKAVSLTSALNRSSATLGAGSLVVWSYELDGDSDWSRRLQEELEGCLTFVERWAIDSDGRIDDIHSKSFGERKSIFNSDISQNLFNHRSKTTIDEAGYHVGRLRSYAGWYYPELSKELELIQIKLNSTVECISKLRSESLGSVDVTTQEIEPLNIDSVKNRQNGIVCGGCADDGSMHLQRRCDADIHLSSLIELTSGLAYASSQALSGITSVFENPGLIFPHTLLGAATAWRSINGAYQEIFSVLRKVNFPEIVRERLTGERPGQTVSNPTLAPRVVHFSGRHGFGETETAITYPTQALSHCISSNWTLTTVTHEALHSEVRLLLSAIFTFRVQGRILTFSESLLEVAGRYLRKIAPLKGTQAFKKIGELECPQERIAFEILWQGLAFAEAYAKAASRVARRPGETPEQFDPVLPKNPVRFLHRLKTALKVFEEFFVHTLDLEYFYGGDTELFSKSIWSSWSMVPSVASNFDLYLLRTLVVVGGVYSGPFYDRLKLAKRDLKKALGELIKIQPSNDVLKHALNILDIEQGPEKTWIDRLFPESCRFVDLVRRDLVSEDLVSAFNINGDGIKDEDVSLGEFLSVPPNSILGLLRFNKNSELTNGGVRRDRVSELRDSAWLLLAAASSKQNHIYKSEDT